MEKFPKNLTVVLIDSNGSHGIIKDFNQLNSFFEISDENIFRELLVYTTTLTRSNQASTLAIFEDGAICAYPNRSYKSVEELLLPAGTG
jgi:hypothetical protein